MALLKAETYYRPLPDGNYAPINTEPKIVATPVPSKQDISDLTPITKGDLDWDGWPNGNFEQDFSWKEIEDTSN